MIAFYIGLTGFACTIYYRREIFRSVKNFFFVGLGPLVGGVILFYLLIKNAIELSDPANSESGNSWLGIGPPLLIAAFFLVLGVILMFVQWRATPSFFKRKPRLPRPGSSRAKSSYRRPRLPAAGSEEAEMARDRGRIRRLGLRQGGADEA